MAQTINTQGCTQWYHYHLMIPLTPTGVSDTSDLLCMTGVTMLLLLSCMGHCNSKSTAHNALTITRPWLYMQHN